MCSLLDFCGDREAAENGEVNREACRMKRVLPTLLLLVLSVGVLLACACTNTEIGPEAERAAEKVTVETAVRALMQEKGLTDLSRYSDGTPTGAPVRNYSAGEATNDMAIFPSSVWHIYHDGKEGYIRLRMSTTTPLRMMAGCASSEMRPRRWNTALSDAVVRSPEAPLP
jgi:hypothetical protein